MKSKKLNLKDIKVASFTTKTTEQEVKTVKGGRTTPVCSEIICITQPPICNEWTIIL